VVFRPEREAQVIDGLKAVNPGPLQNDSVAPIWREIMSACRALETPTRVAYLGPAGTFSEEAALGYFGSSIVRVPCASIDEVIHARHRRRRRLRRGAGGEQHRRRGGTLARPVPDHAAVHHRRDQPLRAPQPAAQGELAGRHQGRLRPPAGAGAVPRLAVSHHLPDAERRPVASNAEGARLAGLGPGAGRDRQHDRAASEFGLHVVAPRRSRTTPTTARASPSSPTRQAPGAQGLGHDCTSLVVSVANRPGAVHDMLVPLKTHGVSMTRFESRPARSGQWEYYFYIDIEGHPTSRRRPPRLKELRDACAFFKVLGTYPIDVH
jgi:chorismate mutase/prephenate dehydratase